MCLGYIIKSVEGADLTYLIIPLPSVLFEIYVFIFYVMALVYYLRQHAMIQSFDGKNLLSVLLLKNFEQKTIYDLEDDVIQLGTSQQFVQESAANIVKKANNKKYKNDMQRLAKHIRRNFLDCFWFQHLNKELYLVMIVTQIMSSMAFNGLFDIPALLMILALFSFYTFRKSIPEATAYLRWA